MHKAWLSPYFLILLLINPLSSVTNTKYQITLKLAGFVKSQFHYYSCKFQIFTVPIRFYESLNEQNRMWKLGRAMYLR